MNEKIFYISAISDQVFEVELQGGGYSYPQPCFRDPLQLLAEGYTCIPVEIAAFYGWPDCE